MSGVKKLDTVRAPTAQEIAQLKPDSPAILLRMDRVLMEYPFFAIQKKPPTERRVFELGDTQITITPSLDGQATYWDLDILRYAFSQLNAAIEEGQPTSPEIIFVAHKFLTTSGRTTGKAGYVALRDALRRLAGTRIETNIKSGGKRAITGFAWIESYELLGDDDGDGGIKRLKGIKLKLSDWVYDAIVQDRRVLAFSPEYFALSGGLERRLYDIARKFCGNSEFWPVSLVNLHQRIGTSQPLKRLRMELQEVIDNDSLPDYRLEFVNLPVAEPGKPVPRVNLERLQLRFRRKSRGRLPYDAPASTDDAIDVPFRVVPADSPVFPDSGGIRYGRWGPIARDNLPKPTPDIDMVAEGFRKWARERGVSLDAKNIEATFTGFCKKWRMDRF